MANYINLFGERNLTAIRGAIQYLPAIFRLIGISSWAHSFPSSRFLWCFLSYLQSSRLIWPDGEGTAKLVTSTRSSRQRRLASASTTGALITRVKVQMRQEQEKCRGHSADFRNHLRTQCQHIQRSRVNLNKIYFS